MDLKRIHAIGALVMIKQLYLGFLISKTLLSLHISGGGFVYPRRGRLNFTLQYTVVLSASFVTTSNINPELQ